MSLLTRLLWRWSTLLSYTIITSTSLYRLSQFLPLVIGQSLGGLIKIAHGPVGGVDDVRHQLRPCVPNHLERRD
jgi:hypothetical protein